MFLIKNNQIYHTRGDTATFAFHPLDADGNALEDYTAMLSVKKRLKDADYLFQAEIKGGLCQITHEMTRDLPFGDYYYDIEINHNGNYTTFGPYEYHLMPDVTR